MSQNESTTFLVTDAKNLTLIDATGENSPWWFGDQQNFWVESKFWVQNKEQMFLSKNFKDNEYGTSDQNTDGFNLPAFDLRASVQNLWVWWWLHMILPGRTHFVQNVYMCVIFPSQSKNVVVLIKVNNIVIALIFYTVSYIRILCLLILTYQKNSTFWFIRNWFCNFKLFFDGSP